MAQTYAQERNFLGQYLLNMLNGNLTIHWITRTIRAKDAVKFFFDIKRIHIPRDTNNFKTTRQKLAKQTMFNPAINHHYLAAIPDFWRIAHNFVDAGALHHVCHIEGFIKITPVWTDFFQVNVS